MEALIPVQQLGGAHPMPALAVGLTEVLARAWIPNHLVGECRLPNTDSVVGNQIFFSRAPGKYIIKCIYLKKNPNQFVQRVVYFDSIFDTFFSFLKGKKKEKVK